MITVLITLSVVLTASVMFPRITAPAIFTIMAVCAGIALLGGTAALVHGRRSRAAGAVTVQPGEPAVDKMSWRMPPLSELPPALIKGGKRIGLLGLRGYLAVAMVMVVVKVVETALGH